MLAKLRTTPSVKLVVVTLIGCLLFTSCGGGGDDTEGGARDESGPNTTEPPRRVTLSLSEFTQDTSQGKAIVVDYAGPDFDEEELRVRVGDVSVESVVVDNQIHLILPLTQSGLTALEFDFGDFSSRLSVDITQAPTIADPPAYVSSVVEDLVAELGALPEGDWQNELDALSAAAEELVNLSEAEIRELAIFLKQNLDPHLRQVNAPVVAQFDAAACEDEMRRFTFNGVAVRIAIAAVFVYAAAPEVSKILGIPITLGIAVLATVRLLEATDDLLNACLVSGVADIQAALVTTAGVKVAQQDSETISTIRFDEGQAKAITLSLNRTFDPERRAEFVSAMQGLGDLLLKLNDGLRSVVDILPSFLSWLAGGINSFIAKFDGFISTFAGLENPDRVETVNHADFRLEGISDRNITGSITDASSDRLFLEFNFEDSTRIPQDGCVDFDFTLSTSRGGLRDVSVSSRLCVAALAPPNRVAAKALSTSELVLTWVSPSNNAGITGYIIDQHVGSEVYNIASVGADVTRVRVVELQPGSEYCFSVKSVSNARTSNPSDVVCDSTKADASGGSDTSDDSDTSDVTPRADYLLCAGYIPKSTDTYIYDFTWEEVQVSLPGARYSTFHHTGRYSYNEWSGGFTLVQSGPHCSACWAGTALVDIPGGTLSVKCSEYQDTIDDAWKDHYETPVKTISIPWAPRKMTRCRAKLV